MAILGAVALSACGEPGVQRGIVAGVSAPRLAAPVPRTRSNKEQVMIELSVRCVDEAGGEGTRAQPTDVCSYVGQPQVYLEIDITNRGATEIGFPLTALQSQGPRVRLVDNESGRDYVLPASMPAPLVYTLLAPGRTVKLSWVIGREELERLGARRVDATAEISVTVNVRVGDALMPVTSAAKLRIVEQEQAKPLSR